MTEAQGVFPLRSKRGQRRLLTKLCSHKTAGPTNLLGNNDEQRHIVAHSPPVRSCDQEPRTHDGYTQASGHDLRLHLLLALARNDTLSPPSEWVVAPAPSAAAAPLSGDLRQIERALLPCGLLVPWPNRDQAVSQGGGLRRIVPSLRHRIWRRRPWVCDFEAGMADEIHSDRAPLDCGNHRSQLRLLVGGLLREGQPRPRHHQHRSRRRLMPRGRGR